jgi:hypothetical protein
MTTDGLMLALGCVVVVALQDRLAVLALRACDLIEFALRREWR